MGVSGCVLLQSMGLMETPRGFSHRIHGDAGLECSDCHEPESGEPTLPTQDFCMVCHEDMDPEKPAELRASTLFEDGTLGNGPSPQAFSDEILFGHAAHTDAGLDCASCHADIASSETLGDDWRPSMADCTSCHEAAGDSPADCSLCHAELDSDVAPSSHAQLWTRLHGQAVRADTGASVDDCSLCHGREECVSCHEEEPPANHTNVWRLRTHGVVAAIDRDNCAVCHRADSCDRCHEETLPLSHRGGFGAPKATHCFGCHFPVQQQSCFVCHKGTPSHELAAPKPADHSPGLNCRQCHGVDAPLPHVDAGQNCNICHK